MAVTKVFDAISGFYLESKAFENNSAIPKEYTCDVKSQKIPDLEWNNAPKNTKSFVIICDDPDAPQREPWVHWVVYDIPGDKKALPQNLERKTSLPDGIKQGLTSFKKSGYDGPCPPSGEHRYFFKLYALDIETLGLKPEATKEDVLKAMQGHIIDQAELMGTYKR